MVGIADPNETRARQILQQKRQGPHADMYAECQVFPSYQDALTAGGMDVAFIGEGTMLLCLNNSTKYFCCNSI